MMYYSRLFFAIVDCIMKSQESPLKSVWGRMQFIDKKKKFTAGANDQLCSPGPKYTNRPFFFLTSTLVLC